MTASSENVRRAALSRVRSRRGEALGAVLILLGLGLLLSLVSYDPADPSWNVISARARPVNYIGSVGSHLADATLQTFGVMGYTIPPLLLLYGGLIFRSKRWSGLVIRTTGWLALIPCLGGLMTLFTPEGVFLSENIRPGGFVGLVLASAMESHLNLVGTGLVLTCFTMLSVMLAGDISYVESARRFQGGFSGILHSLRWRRPVPDLRVTPEDVRPSISRMRETAIPGSPQVGGMGEDLASLDEYEGFEQIPLIRSDGPVSSSEPGELESITHIVARPGLGGEAVGPARTRAGPAPGSDPDRRTVGLSSSRVAATRTAAPEFIEAEEDAEIAEMLSTASVRQIKRSEDEVKVPHAPRRARRADGDFILPSPTMLTEPLPTVQSSDSGQEALLQVAHQLAAKCKEFAVAGHVQQISPGPVVTTFEFKPDPGIKYSRITGLVDDLCLALEAESIRIDRIPGKSTVGIEVPNRNREVISLREIIESRRFQETKSKLAIALGKTIDGSIYVADLAKMPHLLIAGSTGAGKSVTVNSLIVSMLFKASPEDVRFIMIDPKRVELGLYAEIPHLLVPIVTDPKRATYALKWAVAEMEKRYRQLAGFGVRNIEQFNHDLKERGVRELIGENGEPVGKLPYLVIVIDELADMMMVASNDVETSITRLAQMARAVGIHLVLTTQRPSVDVITGLIKANFPCRVAFRVSSKVDSRTIIDTNGAEQLLGKGDMLFLPPGTARLIRVHGAFVDEKEIKRIVDFIRGQSEPSYDPTVLLSDKEVAEAESGGGQRDELYEDALRIVIQMGRASTSVLQRRLRIGYGRAAAIIDMMEREGFVEAADGTRPRAMTSKAAEFRERLQQMKEEGA
ncbi:MAG: DNA translocase FtsK [Acidobacteria bacterium]|nr:DNA translocase FtsK [Acidobacteriota bacterium]